MSSISDAVTEWQQQRMSGSALMREIVSYKKWSVQVSDAAVGEALNEGTLSRLMFVTDQNGVSRLCLFSDGDAYSRYCQMVGDAAAAPATFLSTSGSWIFQLPLDAIDMVCLDPGTPPDINYRKEQYPQLKALAEAIEVEEAIAALRTGENTNDGMLKLVRDYTGYYIAVNKVGEDYSLALAPDSKGRALAAVFTFDDAYKAYYPQCREMYPDGELLRLPLAGAELFKQLQQRDLVGMVFNCCGPGKPIAFAAQFAEVVLNAE